MHQAVIDIGFGDSGKGRVVDYLCSILDPSLVIRFSGGHQAAHQVITEDINHVFSNFGSGTLRGVPTYWSKYCTVDPVGIINELRILQAKGVDPLLYIDERCPVTTPFDKASNIKLNRVNGHGSCGVGFGQTLQREEDRYSLLFGDLFNYNIFSIKIGLIADDYYRDIRIATDDHDEFIDNALRLAKIKNIRITSGIPKVGTYIFEGSQGLLIDQDIGFFPHVSRTNCGSKNILKMGINPKINLVTRAYQTRHGNGPMTNEHIPHNIKVNLYEQNTSDGLQGEFRITLLDLDLLKYAINKDNYIRWNRKTLFITCLDLIGNEYRFTINGKIINCINEAEFVDKVKNFLEIDEVFLSRLPYGDVEIYKEDCEANKRW